MGRSRRVIIPIRTRFRSIENVAVLGSSRITFGKSSQGLLATPAPTFSESNLLLLSS